MDPSLLLKLSQYCDKLIDETSPTNPSPTTKASKRSEEVDDGLSPSKQISSRTLKRNIPVDDKTNLENLWSLENTKPKKKLKKKKLRESGSLNEFQENKANNDSHNGLENLHSESIDIAKISGTTKVYCEPSKENSGESFQSNLFTDDGFKIVSSVPDDDSDISDAFESDIEEGDGSSHKDLSISREEKVRTTEDGFKITSDIPPDDSDISDAFTDGEEDCNDTGAELIAQREHLHSSKTVSKPILQMIDEFGLGGDVLKESSLELPKNHNLKNNVPKVIYGVRNSKKRKKKKKPVLPLNTTTLASKINPQVDVTVVDYAGPRNAKKNVKKTSASKKQPAVVDPEKSRENARMQREKLENQLKKMRFDIFKLGMTRANKKEERKETRATLAIKLGAKPTKNKYVKYKNLLVTKKTEKEQKKEQQQLKKDMGIKEKKFKQQNPKDKKKKRAFTGQVGRYKDGVLQLSKKDIKKIKKA